MPKPLFKLKNFSVSYKDFQALKNINIEINKGEKIIFIGPSGSGKTTILKSLFKKRSNQCSFIHQDYALVNQLSVYNNVYSARLNKYSNWRNILNLFKPNKVCLKDIYQILIDLDMSEKIHEKAGELSGGQKQRVAIAKSIYQNKPIIIADEPVSSVDPHKAEKLIKKIMNSSETVVMSLHNVDLAIKFSSRLLGVYQGKIIFDKTKNNISDADLINLFNPI
ncbi:MAG: ATP-binding cassette domain-containing protein [Candidatus Neomarinimicrobiota bacterium]|nr:ATP-binding cassette domain-containing protein [Candidatus Neomarinimicrobiota bacterium]